MLSINELKSERELINRIDWTITPDKAVDMYLEWGAGWTRGNDFVRREGEESIYFVLYDWESPAQVTLLSRTSKEVRELAKIEIPPHFVEELVNEFGRKAGVGVYPLNRELKLWLSELLDGPPVEMEN